MSFWAWLDRRWPSERAWVTMATFALAASMLKMAEVHRDLWNVELFKTLLTLVIGTAIVNMILAFHFTANKSDETKAANTGKMADAMKAVAENAGPPADATDAAADAAEQTADAAAKKADEFRAPPPVDYKTFPSDDEKR